MLQTCNEHGLDVLVVWDPSSGNRSCPLCAQLEEVAEEFQTSQDEVATLTARVKELEERIAEADE